MRAGPVNLMGVEELIAVCGQVVELLQQSSTLVEVQAPCKVRPVRGAESTWSSPHSGPRRLLLAIACGCLWP